MIVDVIQPPIFLKKCFFNVKHIPVNALTDLKNKFCFMLF